MRIAVNARCLGQDTGTGYYSAGLLYRLAALHPEHTFIFFSNAPLPGTFPANVIVYVLDIKLRHPLTLRWPLDRKVKKGLQKNKADIFISLDGTGCLSTRIPQVVGVADAAALYTGKGWLLNHFREKSLRKLFGKAAAVITTSRALQDRVARRFTAAGGKITVIPVAANGAATLAATGPEEIRTAFTGGTEYFLFPGGFDPSNRLLNVLRAFSQFKKWQQSEMKIVITGNTTDDPEGMRQKISTFKFRDDVVIAGNIDAVDARRLMSAAYAVVYTPPALATGREIAEAMASGTAVIATPSPAADIAGAAFLSVDDTESSLAEAMIRLYKDEALRSRLAAEGMKRSQEYTWDVAAQKLWEVIGSVAGEKAGG